MRTAPLLVDFIYASVCKLLAKNEYIRVSTPNTQRLEKVIKGRAAKYFSGLQKGLLQNAIILQQPLCYTPKGN